MFSNKMLTKGEDKQCNMFLNSNFYQTPLGQTQIISIIAIVLLTTLNFLYYNYIN